MLQLLSSCFAPLGPKIVEISESGQVIGCVCVWCGVWGPHPAVSVCGVSPLDGALALECRACSVLGLESLLTGSGDRQGAGG